MLRAREKNKINTEDVAELKMERKGSRGNRSLRSVETYCHN